MSFSSCCASLLWSKSSRRLALAALGGVMGLVSVQAQYPGHSASKVKAGPVLRAVGVLEWTGQRGKPSASRLIPVTVFHDGEYEDAGLYLARPEPLSLNSGTEYQLLEAGLPQGVFDVFGAHQLGGDWFGFGAWKPLPPPEAVQKRSAARLTPEVVDGGDDRRPHFRKAAPEEASGGTVNPPGDPDRPTLRKRAGDAPDTSATANAGAVAATGRMETVTPGADADRPRLSHGVPKDQPQEVKQLEGTPPGVEQMVAVSDAENRPEHSFKYSWSDPADETKLKGQLVTLAEEAVRKAGVASPALASKKGAAGTTTKTTRTAGAASASGHRAGTAGRKAAVVKDAVLLTDVQVRSYELTYSAGATMVLTARTAGDEAKAKYVTVIAQPDIYGTPQVLFTRVTSADDLDASPRMRLVDAVDVAGDNRGDLLFELRGATSRQFAVYRVATGRVDQMMATGPLPLGKASAD